LKGEKPHAKDSEFRPDEKTHVQRWKTVFHQRDRTPGLVLYDPDPAGIRRRDEAVIGKVAFVSMDFWITMKGRAL
jgi:hypothetical protein